MKIQWTGHVHRMQDWRILRMKKEGLRIGGGMQLGKTRTNHLELEIGRWLPTIGKIGRRSLGKPEVSLVSFHGIPMRTRPCQPTDNLTLTCLLKPALHPVL